MLDGGGAKRPVVLGCVLAAVGFFVWGGKVAGLHQGDQVTWIIVAGAGTGLMLGQSNTDAINRAGRLSYGEATGITQTVRNYGASLGFAILGTGGGRARAGHHGGGGRRAGGRRLTPARNWPANPMLRSRAHPAR